MIERWLVTRAHDAIQWSVEAYTTGQPPHRAKYSSVALAATALANNDPVSIEGPTETAIGLYAIVRIERREK